MPRSRRSQVVIPTNSMVASAVRYAGNAARIYRGSKAWQVECYRHYGICGEARYAASYFGHAMSRAVLYAAKKTDDGPVKDTTGQGAQFLDDLFSGKQGQAQMLESIGLHLTIAGECYLVGRQMIQEDGTNADHWEIVSVTEMRVVGTKWSIHYGDDVPDVPLSRDDVVIRIWRPDPANRMEADSPFKSLLPILDEIEWLTLHIFAQVRSRLAGAGLLLVSDGLDFPPPPPIDGKPQEVANKAEGFMRTLGESMLTPIRDPGNPSAVIPVIGTVPADQIGKATEFIKFWSPLDEHSKSLRDEAIRRFALGMDMPPEQVLGMHSSGGTGGGKSNGVSHWGAWQIDESTIKMHIEPALELVCNALTIGYLRPLTEDPNDLVIYDSAALRLRPDRSKEAVELWDRGALSTNKMLTENGFDPIQDRMVGTDLTNFLLMKVAAGSATPEQVEAALLALGIDLHITNPGTTVREARPAPSLVDHPTRPATPDAALLAASEALVFRALERAGNRIRGRDGVKPPGVPAHSIHTVMRVNGSADTYLADAWSCAPDVLAGLADVETVIASLDSYCRSLFAEQAPHSRERLRQWLAATGR